MKSRTPLRSLAEGAIFQVAFTAIALGALRQWARVCEARRTRSPRGAVRT